jgi:hypothetical protein
VARYKSKPGEDIRLSRNLDTIRRKAVAVRTNVPMSARRAFVFNEAEIAVLERIARGEEVPEVVLMPDIDRRRWAKVHLAWPYVYEEAGA